MRRRTTKLSSQMKTHVKTAKKPVLDYEGNTEIMISTGSTLLDLAITGGRKRGGGIPAGIFVEIFGPNSAGKTVLLCEIAGAVQRQGGDIMFQDTEGRLDTQFAKIFDAKITAKNYANPKLVKEMFLSVDNWETKVKPGKVIDGVFIDSLAALSTSLEMGNDDGDKMGMKRAKDFSEGFRKTCLVLSDKNRLMVASNQIRDNTNIGGISVTAPGGKAPGFYASLRLRLMNPVELRDKKTIHGREISRTYGISTEIKVFKSSVWKPFRTAKVFIIFDYGVDDIRANLQFIKDFTSNKIYTINGKSLDKSMDASIRMIEEDSLEKYLKEEVIDLWELIETKFKKIRKPKKR